MSAIEKFLPIVLEEEEESNNSPIMVWGDVTFVYIKYNNLYIVATTKINANATLIFSFLHKLVQVFISLLMFFLQEKILVIIFQEYIALIQAVA